MTQSLLFVKLIYVFRAIVWIVDPQGARGKKNRARKCFVRLLKIMRLLLDLYEKKELVKTFHCLCVILYSNLVWWSRLARKGCALLVLDGCWLEDFVVLNFDNAGNGCFQIEFPSSVNPRSDLDATRRLFILSPSSSFHPILVPCFSFVSRSFYS